MIIMQQLTNLPPAWPAAPPAPIPPAPLVTPPALEKMKQQRPKVMITDYLKMRTKEEVDLVHFGNYQW